MFRSLRAREDLWPPIVRGRRRRNLLVIAVVLAAAYGLGALYADHAGVNWERLLSWPGPLLLTLPAVFFLALVLVFSPWQLRDELHKETQNRLVLSDRGFLWETDRRRYDVRWHHIQAIHDYRSSSGHVVYVAFPGGGARFATDWRDDAEPLPELRISWGVPQLRENGRVFRDPRRTPAAAHPLTKVLLERTGLDLR